MNSAIEFHDSEIQAIESSTGIVRVIFSSAYVHCSPGTPGADAGKGFTQPVELVFYGARTTGDARVVGNLADGDVNVGGKSLGLLPLPYSISGDVTAKFVFASGAKVSITAQALECLPTGGRAFVEEYGA